MPASMVYGHSVSFAAGEVGELGYLVWHTVGAHTRFEMRLCEMHLAGSLFPYFPASPVLRNAGIVQPARLAQSLQWAGEQRQGGRKTAPWRGPAGGMGWAAGVEPRTLVAARRLHAQLPPQMGGRCMLMPIRAHLADGWVVEVALSPEAHLGARRQDHNISSTATRACLACCCPLNHLLATESTTNKTDAPCPSAAGHTPHATTCGHNPTAQGSTSLAASE